MRSSNLKNFLDFIVEKSKIIESVREVLSQQQEKFETYFNEVKNTREHELKQIMDHILEDRSKLYTDMDKKLNQTVKSERKLFRKKLSELKEKKKKLTQEAEKLRVQSSEEEKRLRAQNVDLDKEEERLKLRNEKLLKRIFDYNRRIKEMSKGFGFFRNIFRMKQLQNERKLLDEEQANLVFRIDAIRKKWETADSTFTLEEKARKDNWLRTTTDAAAIQAKIDHLIASQEQIIQRSAFEKILFAHSLRLPQAADGDPKCPRCCVPNPKSAHFCRICAYRLGKDRPDLAGSLEEIAELNQHYVNFSNGLKACQEIIGLVGGLKGGLDNFSKSVSDMIETQRKHSLSVLKLNIPEKTKDYANNFKALDERVRKLNTSLHPVEFSAHINSFIDRVFTEEKIKDFFESMGHELSEKADAQW